MPIRVYTDRTLRAYAKGRLTPRQRASIEVALRADPHLRARLRDLAGLSVLLQSAVSVLRRDPAVQRLHDWLARVIAAHSLS